MFCHPPFLTSSTTSCHWASSTHHSVHGWVLESTSSLATLLSLRSCNLLCHNEKPKKPNQTTTEQPQKFSLIIHFLFCYNFFCLQPRGCLEACFEAYHQDEKDCLFWLQVRMVENRSCSRGCKCLFPVLQKARCFALKLLSPLWV